jgi:hypothetical protein
MGRIGAFPPVNVSGTKKIGVFLDIRGKTLVLQCFMFYILFVACGSVDFRGDGKRAVRVHRVFHFIIREGLK